ncbi:hypothetical protein LRS13_02410 [Svornostia abyssi]|uniref:Uncharacterized protein n=1 Tax=Svornostia abyssi TaxID=2898438 RepID=A0ABY5PIA1_9ACTN|nr:hypothetical protein LRS13_02410 [Parviterribacteraceae bacterium J379]
MMCAASSVVIAGIPFVTADDAIRVRTSPMWTVVAVTPSGRISCATQRTHMSNAAFDERYADHAGAIGMPYTPQVDVLTR